jgi:hypothetical protein
MFSAVARAGFIDKSQIFMNGFSDHEYLEFIENVICDLPDTFEDRFYLSSGSTYVEDQLLLAESRLYQIRLSDFGDQYVINVVVPPHGNLTKLGCFCLETASSDIFDSISIHYDVWTTQCLRTSRRYLPSVFNKPPKIDPLLISL